MAASVIRDLHCAECLRLYVFLTLRQGTNSSYAVRGIRRIAEELVWQDKTARKHVRHLADAGLIDLDPVPTRSWGNTRLRVIHEPSSGMISPRQTQVAKVWGPQDSRWRPPNRLDTLGITDAERDTPSVGEAESTELGRTAPSVRAEARCDSPGSATRLDDWPDAGCTAPSVPRSTRSGSGLTLPEQPEGSPFGMPCGECEVVDGDAPYAVVAVRSAEGWWGWWCEEHAIDAVHTAGELESAPGIEIVSEEAGDRAHARSRARDAWAS